MLGSLAQSKVNEGKASVMTGANKASGKAKVKYSAVFAILLAIPAALGWLEFETVPYFFIGMQVYSLLIGILHLWQMGRRFGWRNINSFYQKMSLTLSILLIAMVLQAIIIFFCTPLKPFWIIFPTSILFFVFPLITISTFDLAVIIPPPIYKKWRYPENGVLPDPDSIDFSNSSILIITLEIKKKSSDSVNTQMKFKAPQDKLSFGELFLFWMSEYNESDRLNRVQFFDDLQKPHEWLFYVKPKNWWISKLYIDPSLTIKENKLIENCIIVSERV